MTTSSDAYGRPKGLEDPNEIGFVNYRVDSAFVNPRDRLTSDRSANLDDVMLLIDMLLKRYESTYKIHDTDKSLLYMPYLFSKPRSGLELRNRNTGEMYSVLETVNNPATGQWEGLVRIRYRTAPDPLLGHKLEFVTEAGIVRFTESFPVALGNEAQTTDGLMVDKGPMKPTVVYTLVKKECGSTDRKPFGDRKEYKHHLRQTIKDPDSPNHSIEIYGRWFDNIVQFDCCTTDNLSANRLARWFEKFIDLYDWVLKLNGVQQLLYWTRFNDMTAQKWRQDLVVRSIQYYFRTEEIEAITRRDITAINIATNVARGITDTSTKYIAAQPISGQITEQEYFSLFRDSSGKYLFGNLYYNDGNL